MNKTFRVLTVLSVAAILGTCLMAPVFATPPTISAQQTASLTADRIDDKCPDTFFLANATGGDQTVTAVTGNSASTGTQPTATVWYWTSTGDGCDDFDHGTGVAYKCKGWPVPNNVTVCFPSGGCTTVLSCGQAQVFAPLSSNSPGALGPIAIYEHRFAEELSHVTITEADVEAVDELYSAAVADGVVEPQVYLYKTLERNDDGTWSAYHNVFLYDGTPVKKTTTMSGQKIEAPGMIHIDATE